MSEDGEILPPEDNIPPTVSIVLGEITEDSIEVTVEAVYNESGLATSGTYKYYLNGEEKITSESNSYTFTGLTAETQYTIKVEAFDKAGNKGENSTTIKTNKLDIADIVGGDEIKDTTEVEDDLKNKVIIPGGFGVAEDSGTKIEDGIVIEDSNGNQFVWIPVGTYKTSNGEKTNNLSRRSFTSSEATEVEGDAEIDSCYGEGINNSPAEDTIGAFKTSATNNKGFYIGRYEQGEENVCKKGVNAYTDINRANAMSQAEAMYNGNENVKSELISSYAWDTALNFICQNNSKGYILATTELSTYGNMGTGKKELTGGYSADKYCNIYDFLGNCRELTTEDYDSSYGYWVNRGGHYAKRNNYTSFFAANRDSRNSTFPIISFRVQLYIK